MAARLVINEDPEVLMKDIAEGYVKGNHTLEEMMNLMEVIGKHVKLSLR